ncbi:MAG: hypothetical protein Q7Q71_16270 [Verrucomicrobiota bacterium JB023]|nr:hypothetical protein [Verrucomicrobiota bacterium JB023]
MNARLISTIVAFTLFASVADVQAQDEGPLHLVVSKAGNSVATYGTDDEILFTLMAEIEGSLNFSLSGDFKKAEIVDASTVAPDGKVYQLKAVGEQPPARPGNLMKFLRVTHGDAYTDFSIGRWKVTVNFKVDDEAYTHKADYLITWRKPDHGIWGMQHWANETIAEQTTEAN